jgi:hypothetical protein
MHVLMLCACMCATIAGWAPALTAVVADGLWSPNAAKAHAAWLMRPVQCSLSNGPAGSVDEEGQSRLFSTTHGFERWEYHSVEY